MAISGSFNHSTHQPHHFISEIADSIEKFVLFVRNYSRSYFGSQPFEAALPPFANYITSTARNALDPNLTASVEEAYSRVFDTIKRDGFPIDSNKRLEPEDDAMCLGGALHFIQDILPHFNDEDFEDKISEVSKTFSEGGDAQDLAVTQMQSIRDKSKP